MLDVVAHWRNLANCAVVAMRDVATVTVATCSSASSVVLKLVQVSRHKGNNVRSNKSPAMDEKG